MTKVTIIGQINTKALEILDKNPNGLPWSKLLNEIENAYPDFHPKTINGCVWKLIEKFPDQVYKTSDNLFRLKKYNN